MTVRHWEDRVCDICGKVEPVVRGVPTDDPLDRLMFQGYRQVVRDGFNERSKWCLDVDVCAKCREEPERRLSELFAGVDREIARRFGAGPTEVKR